MWFFVIDIDNEDGISNNTSKKKTHQTVEFIASVVANIYSIHILVGNQESGLETIYLRR